MKQEALEKEVREIVSEQLQLNLDLVTLEKSFSEDLSTDSLDLTELIMAFEERFGFEIPQEEAEKLYIVRDVVAYIQKKRNEKKTPPAA
ncbi:MAG: acyl carrier protein [Chlamydiales bacterium]|nr:acyl carrier protein [Chlamydiales bacterium]